MSAVILLAVAASVFDCSNLPGVWHNSTCVGSGYSEIYALCPDSSFRWRESQMDGMSRVREVRGTWSLAGDTLVLEADSVLVWEGGEVVPAECSIGTDSMLVGFIEAMHHPVPPDTLRVRISNLRLDTMDENSDLPDNLWGMDFEGSRFWRIGSPGPDMDWVFEDWISES
ncbi:hypothetical protein GX411_06550 [Candidatus Fermentibacteria bacterium]|nr:hypothetical protein [Candidatus Fermentibacteria bacterium]